MAHAYRGGDVFDGTKSVVTNVFEQDNGKTYFLDKYIQPSLRSAYKIMSETPEFSEFSICSTGVPDTYASQIFEQQGIDYRIKFSVHSDIRFMSPPTRLCRMQLRMAPSFRGKISMP